MVFVFLTLPFSESDFKVSVLDKESVGKKNDPLFSLQSVAGTSSVPP